MTWWWRTVHAAWRRYDEWRKRRENRWMYDRLSIWVTEEHIPGVVDTGSIVATPEDLAEIGPMDPVRMPGQRRGRHRADPGEGT